MILGDTQPLSLDVDVEGSGIIPNQYRPADLSLAMDQ
jgi:hypothetical protein